MLYPLTFHPIFQERIWGGRNLDTLFQKPLPPRAKIGESWEIVDRPDETSIVAHGPLAGKTLRWLMAEHRELLLGRTRPARDRFPLLIKILDAQETLSLQVHPPEAVARRLEGEPKTEMWYISHAAPGAEIYAGFRKGITRSDLERGLQSGSVADCFHRIQVQPGDVMYLPSGRVHAIGRGLVIFEVQQNSDTTYRVFDWNRVDSATGRPRALHRQESLDSMDFNDFEPGLVHAEPTGVAGVSWRLLVENRLFSVALAEAEAGASLKLAQRGHAEIVALVHGTLRVAHSTSPIEIGAGGFTLLPACLRDVEVQARRASRFLLVRAL